MSTTWTFEAGRIWATLPDGRRLPTWQADPPFHYLVDLLNANHNLSRVLLNAWIGRV